MTQPVGMVKCVRRMLYLTSLPLVFLICLADVADANNRETNNLESSFEEYEKNAPRSLSFNERNLNRLQLFNFDEENFNSLRMHRADAQTVSGTITDSKGEALAGVSVAVKGTTRGTSTDAAGKFVIEADPDETLIFSAIGYAKREMLVGNQTEINLSLAEEAIMQAEVVVTALGIKRDKRALGYSVQEVNGENLTTAKEANVATTLAGKVAGVQVTRSANGAGGSSRVVIRGANSLSGNSQPLYVIDGMPMDNSNANSPGRTGGIDFGDGISNINPEDIESMSVLKGPNAAALYGQRGSNGVILITTKSGKSRKGIGVKVSSDFSMGTALVLPDFQDEYGQGFGGQFTHYKTPDGKVNSWPTNGDIKGGIPKMSSGRDRFTRASWGPKMEGQPYEDQWGNRLSLTPQPNTFQKFFNTEKQFINNVSLDGGNENLNYRLSIGNTKIDGYTPTNTLNRNSISLRTVAKITSKLELDAKANYIGQQGQNRPTVSDASDNPAYLFISQPRSLPMSILEQSQWTANDVANQFGYGAGTVYEGLEKTYATNSSTANPYWTRDHTRNSDDRQRLIGFIKLSYQLTKWMRLSARTGTDFYTDQLLRSREKGTYQSLKRNGDFSEEVRRVRENNSDVLLSLTPTISKDFSFSLNLGANHQTFSSRRTGNTGLEFIAANLYSINNTAQNSYLFDLTESSINSVYGAGSIGFREYWFLDFSARNDWSSTLSPKNNSFFYPAVSTSFVVSDALNWQSPAFSFLKARASWAQAGSSGSPYQLSRNYALDQYTHGGQPLVAFTTILPDANLKNELTTSIEFGLEARFLKNRLGFTAVYYDASTKNQILNVPISPSSGYAARRMNAGEIHNRGIEVMLTGTPIHTMSGFSWESTFNFSRNRNQVVSLAEGIPIYLLGDDRNVQVVATPGKPFGTLIGTGFQWLRDANGNRLINPDTGLPIKSSSMYSHEIGNAMPDWIGGFNNSFRYKGFSLTCLVDISQGGKIFSQSLREELIYGTIKKTVPGRDGTYVAQGVVAQKTGEAWVGTGQTNTKQVKAEDYWNVVAFDKDGVVSQELLNDASYVTLREVAFSYRLPSSLLAKTPFRSIKVGVYGRNLFYFQRKTEGFAPEASSFNVGNASLGLESTALPLLRYTGVSLNIEF